MFGYASLIWRPEFEAAEHRAAKVHGWHRSFRMRSRVNRGSLEQPGLVFALLPGGSYFHHTDSFAMMRGDYRNLLGPNRRD